MSEQGTQERQTELAEIGDDDPLMELARIIRDEDLQSDQEYSVTVHY